MGAAVKIVDWIPGKAHQARPILRLVSETLTAGELVAQRIADECSAYDQIETLTAAEREKRLAGWLVVPGRDEQALNGERLFGPGLPSIRPMDPKPQVEIARKAFEAGQFVMLLDGAQVETWDQRITIGAGSVATFIKLTPLRGG